LKVRLKKILSVAAVVLLFIVLLALFSYYRYPWDALTVRLQDEISSQTPYEVSIDKLRPSTPVSIKVVGFKLYRKSPKSIVLNIDELKIKPSIWGLITGKLRFKFKGAAYGGTFDGKVKDIGKEQYEIDFSSTNFMLNKYDYNAALAGTNASVRLDGTMGLVVSGVADATFKNQALKGSIKAANFALLASKFSEIELPELKFASIEVPFEVKGNVLTIKPTSASGESVEARLSGTVNLREPAARSPINLELKLKFKGALKDSLDPFFQWVKEKDTEGFYKIEISGTLGGVKLR